MNMQQQHLDSLLQQARSAPVFVRADDAARYLTSRTGSAATFRHRRMPLSPRTIIATGGVMIIIAVLALIFSLGNSQLEEAPQGQREIEQQQDITAAAERNRPPMTETPAVTAGDDSVKTKKSASSTRKGISKKLRAAQERIQANDPNSEENREKKAKENAMYAEWTKQRIEGYSVYELDASELERIGIVLTDGGGVLERNSGGHSTEMREEADGIVTYRFSFRVKTDSTQQQSAEIKSRSAVLITNSRGRTYSQVLRAGKGPATIASEGDSDFMKTLIPIKVPTDNSFAATETGEYFYIYWFEYESDFIELLPLRVQRAVKEAQRQLKEGDSREREGGAARPLTIAASIFPNPVTQENATVEYTLPESRRVAVSMYDIKGERVRNVAISDRKEKGTWQDQLPIGDVPNGLYLLAVTTDQGEQSVQPVIVER